MDRLSPLDSLFLHVEDGVTHMHIVPCAIFEQPRPEEFVDLVAAKLPLLRGIARRSGSCRVSSDDRVGRRPGTSNLAYHVRHTALSLPAGKQSWTT